MAEKTNSEWVITPGLTLTVDDFFRQYEYLKGKPGRKVPIMIMGDRGVGKSLFVHIYKRLYEKDNEDAKPKKVIKEINVAAIPETLVEDVLFGHIKGAFTGANEDKSGLVEDTDLLCLEEIGDLPRYVQAKLLTFIEDGKYYRVGDTKPQPAKDDLQIVATTNRTAGNEPGQMRLDFYDRFRKFRVPPLYERRWDVLYYIDCFSPDLLRHFHPWEIMALLAHPWRGNVRELQAACLDMELHHLEAEKEAYLQQLPSIAFVQRVHSDLTLSACEQRYQSLKIARVDVKLLESVLNRYNLGLDPANQKKPWGKSTWHLHNLTDEKLKRDKKFGTRTLKINGEFYYTCLNGLVLFGRLFLKSIYSEDDLLLVRTGKKTIPDGSPFRFIEKPTPKHDLLVKDLLEYVVKPKVPAWIKKKPFLNMTDDEYLQWVFPRTVLDVLRDEVREPKENPLDMKENPLDMKRDDLLRVYYKHHLEKANGIKLKAARTAGLAYSTFRDELNKTV